jgi:hypothetical protein
LRLGVMFWRSPTRALRGWPNGDSILGANRFPRRRLIGVEKLSDPAVKDGSGPQLFAFGCFAQTCDANSLSRRRSKFSAISLMKSSCGGPVSSNTQAQSEQPKPLVFSDLTQTIRLNVVPLCGKLLLYLNRMFDGRRGSLYQSLRRSQTTSGEFLRPTVRKGRWVIGSRRR